MSKVKLSRVYSDSQGESHFGEVEVDLDSVDYAPPAPPFDLSTPLPAPGVRFARFPAGWYGDFHPAPRRQWVVFLNGDFEDETSDGDVRHFKAGDIALFEDTTGKGHRARLVSAGDALLLFVELPHRAS